jgi:hypothetical protein
MMKMTGVAIGLALALEATSVFGQSNPRYVQFRPSATKSALYTSDCGPTPTPRSLMSCALQNNNALDVGDGPFSTEFRAVRPSAFSDSSQERTFRQRVCKSTP